MKLKRSPLILLAIALLFGGGVYWNETHPASRQAAEVKPQKLFSFKEEDVQALEVRTRSQTLLFAKMPVSNASPEPKSPTPTPAASTGKPSVWMMTAPRRTAANDASVAYLLNLMATGNNQQTIAAPIAKRAEFGLDIPLATVEVKLLNQQTHRISLGKPNFNRSGLYALVDPPANATSDLAITLVPIDFESAVTRSLSEWQAAEKPIEKKSPEPSASATPQPESSPQ